jgi:hypothetical protein
VVQLPEEIVQVVGLKLPPTEPAVPKVTTLPLAVPAAPLSVAVTVTSAVEL